MTKAKEKEEEIVLLTYIPKKWLHDPGHLYTSQAYVSPETLLGTDVNTGCGVQLALSKEYNGYIQTDDWVWEYNWDGVPHRIDKDEDDA